MNARTNHRLAAPAGPAPRRKKPHPARRARRTVGAAGVGGMLVMTGYMAVNGMPASASTNSTTSNLTVTAGSTTSASKTVTAAAATPAKVAQSTSKSSG